MVAKQQTTLGPLEREFQQTSRQSLHEAEGSSCYRVRNKENPTAIISLCIFVQ